MHGGDTMSWGKQLMTLQRTTMPLSCQSSSPRWLQLLGLLVLEDKDMHICSPNSTVPHPRNFNILPIPMFMLRNFTCTTLNISHLYYQMCSARCGGAGPKDYLMTPGNLLKLNEHFNESKCELTVLNKEEKYVKSVWWHSNSFQFVVGLKKLLTVRTTPGGWKICNTWIFTQKSDTGVRESMFRWLTDIDREK